MVDSNSVNVPDDAVGPLSGSIFAILMGPGGMFEHSPEPPPAVVPPDELLDEPLELHAASPRASTVPTAMGRNL
jgi:hypothetical protein